MERLWTKKERKYYDKLAKSVFARKTKFFRRNVHLNKNETYLKIIRIRNDDDFYNEVEGYKEIPINVCFLIHHVDPKMDKDRYYSVKNTDFIITDYRTNKIISINKRLDDYPFFFNLWIVRKNTASFLKLKLNDIFFTR